MTLIHIKSIEDKIGFFVNYSIDSVSDWKEEKNSFLFKLNQNKQYKKNTFGSANYTFCCKKDCGPSTNCLGCNPDVKLNLNCHNRKSIDKVFEKGSQILPYEGEEIENKVNDMEIFQIIIY